MFKHHRHVDITYPGVRVFHEDKTEIPHGAEVWKPGESPKVQGCQVFYLIPCFDVGPNAEKIDLVVTLGGDGTILHASSLFSAGAVPPVLSFSMGTLGFLLPFRKSPVPYQVTHRHLIYHKTWMILPRH